jgi:transposase-like protein
VGTFVTIDAPAPDLRDNESIVQKQDSLFVRIDEKTIQCNSCKKVLHTHYARHGKICKGVPRNVCRYCRKEFKHRQNVSTHQKNCKSRPVVKSPTVKIATTNNSETAQATTIDGTERNYDNTGFVYLIQPGTCEGTRRFKVGFSAARHLKRVTKGYPKNSTIFCINGGIANPRELETHILREFRTRFELSKCGQEYFEGNIGDMLDVFHETVLKYRVF